MCQPSHYVISNRFFQEKVFEKNKIRENNRKLITLLLYYIPHDIFVMFCDVL
jgi:hypothetical protein